MRRASCCRSRDAPGGLRAVPTCGPSCCRAGRTQKYEFLQRVGEGAYGSVWKCRDKQTGALVAVKKLKEAPASEEVGMPCGRVHAMWGGVRKLDAAGLCVGPGCMHAVQELGRPASPAARGLASMACACTGRG